MFTITRRKAMSIVTGDFVGYYLSGDASWENQRIFTTLFGEELVEKAIEKGLEEAELILNNDGYEEYGDVHPV